MSKYREPSDIIAEYKEYACHYQSKAENLIIFVRELLYDFSSSPIIPPEIIAPLVDRGRSVLSNFHGFNQIIYDAFSPVEALDFSIASVVNTKANRESDQMTTIHSVQERFMKAQNESASVTKSVETLCEDIYFVDNYWCKQHYLNGEIRFHKSDIDYIIGEFKHIENEFYHKCLCLLEELYLYAKSQVAKAQAFYDTLDMLDNN